MNKPKLGKGLSALTGAAVCDPASTYADYDVVDRCRRAAPPAANDDQTGANVQVEQSRYEREIMAFEASVRRERDKMRAEHLEAMRVILGQEAAE